MPPPVHAYCSQAGAVARTVMAPLKPLPGAANTRLKLPDEAGAVNAVATGAATAQPAPEAPGLPLSRTHVFKEVRFKRKLLKAIDGAAVQLSFKLVVNPWVVLK